jgi:hypothetical protein
MALRFVYRLGVYEEDLWHNGRREVHAGRQEKMVILAFCSMQHRRDVIMRSDVINARPPLRIKHRRINR